MKNLIKFICLFLLIVGTSVANAEDLSAFDLKPVPKPTLGSVRSLGEASDDSLFNYNIISNKISVIEYEVKNKQQSDKSLDESLRFLSEQEVILNFAIESIEKNAKYAKDALVALGEGPIEGGNEEETITNMREKYNAAMTGYKNKIIEANLLKTEIARISAMISETKSKMLIAGLVSEQNMLITPKNFVIAISDAAVFFWQIAVSPIVWYQGLTAEEAKSIYYNGWSVLLIVILAFSLGLYLRKYIIKRWGYGRTDEAMRYGQKIIVAIMTAVAYGVIPSLLIGGCLLWQVSNRVLVDNTFGVVLANILYYSLYIILVRALVRVTFAPKNGQWRLFNISDERADKLYKAATLSIVLVGTISCIRKIGLYMEISEQLNLLLEVVADAIKAFIIILLTVRIFGRLKKNTVELSCPLKDEDDDIEDDKMSLSFKIISFTSFFAIATFGVSLFGYPGLATFIFNRFILSVLMAGTFMIARRFIYDLLRRGIVFCIRTFKLRKKLLSKADLLMTLLVNPILVLFFIFSVLNLWGISSNLMIRVIKRIIFGFQVGGIEISLIAIATGVSVFFISLSLVKMFKKRLTNNLLTRINMDEGIKHSLISGMSFVGFIISVILAIIAMGVDLSNLAVIAGALSVGIGFGLQDLIKNLVSGIIILFERPFKVGDWVILAGEEGKIKQINIRSTEVETFNQSSVIIPNATLISSSLKNLTHQNNWQRQSVAVGVSYDSDVDLVTKILMDIAKSSKKLMKVPAPYVLFTNFGASSLDFELRFYVSDIWNGWAVNSEIRYEVLRRFREENITIAYPQLVIHKGEE